MSKNDTLRKQMLKFARELARIKFIDDIGEQTNNDGSVNSYVIMSAKDKEIRAIQKVLNDNPDFSSRELKKMIEEQRIKDANLEKSFLF